MKRLYLYPVWLRIWHWSNSLMYILLIISGISMHYASLDNPVIPFNTARLLHNTAGIILSILYLGFLLGNLFTGNGKHYLPKLKRLITRLVIQSKYYLYGIFLSKPHPYHVSKELKFNPLQQITYIFIMYLMTPILVITGLLLIFPELAPPSFLNAGGIWPMALLHSITSFFLTLFMFGHIYLGTTGTTISSNFKDMITGWHSIPDKNNGVKS